MKGNSALWITVVLSILSLSISLVVSFTLPNESEGSQSDDEERVNATHVYPLNYARAETTELMRTFTTVMGDGENRINQFFHLESTDLGFPFPMANKDTVYSAAVIDTHTGPVQISLPKADRYMSVQCLNQDHYVEYFSLAPTIFYLKKETSHSRYIFCLIRTADTNGDFSEIEPLQQAVNVSAQDVAGPFDDVFYEKDSLRLNRKELKRSFNLMQNSRGMYGSETETDPIAHTLGVAGAPLGLPEYGAIYEGDMVQFNDGSLEYVLTFEDVPVNEFWSITVYTEEGFFFDVESQSINSYQAIPNEDFSYTIHFSNDSSKKNCLNIGEHWMYVVRMYEPKQEIIDGIWSFPKPILFQNSLY